MKRRDFITQGLIGAGVTIASSNVIAKEVLQTQKPNTSFPSVGNKITAKVLSSEIPCTIGMKPGDEFELGFRKCGDFCGFFYSSIHDSIMSLQFGEMGQGSDTLEFVCPNSEKKVKLELTRSAT